jgi:hypothetical protein
LLLHFLLVTVYANKPTTNRTKIDYYASFYVYPYFHQNWNLFVPPPSSNYSLIAYTDKGEIDIFKTILTKHRNNRFAGNEPLVIALTNSIHYFEKNVTTKNCKITDDKNFKIIEHFVKNYLAEKKTDAFKLILLTSDLVTKQNRYYYN